MAPRPSDDRVTSWISSFIEVIDDNGCLPVFLCSRLNTPDETRCYISDVDVENSKRYSLESRLSVSNWSQYVSPIIHNSLTLALRCLLILQTLLTSHTIARADESPQKGPVENYLNRIKPVLQARCVSCHGALKQEAGLRLDTVELMVKGGENGPAIKPMSIEASPLVKRISAEDESLRMPPEGEPLKPDEIAAIKQWIELGAARPDHEQAERDPKDHWAFRSPVRPRLPQPSRPQWVLTPIDSFIAAKHNEFQLTPQPPRSKRLWLRRVSLDLTGLPPTLEEQTAFLDDNTPSAYETVVNRLLASPHYGERWGRHWMDIWRYSDWWGLGAEVRNSQKHIWHWRDWIIESLNADKGYDQMLREMLAADELYPNDLDRLRATGYLARQYFKFNRTSWLDSTIEHTAKGMLGLTFNCAKCHDHKYDPFSQTEYYQIRAIFEPYQIRTDFLPGELDPERNGLARAFDCNLEEHTYLHVRGDDRNPDKSRPITATIPAFLTLDESPFVTKPVVLPLDAHQPGLRQFVVDSHIKAAERQIASARTTLESAKKKLAEAEQLEDSKNATPVDALTALNKITTSNESIVQDDFSVAKPDLWEQIGGTWTYANGKLIQSQDGTARVALQLKPVALKAVSKDAGLPLNFEVKFKVATLGGQMWKSVGIAFDSDDRFESLAYISSVSGGSKSQFSYKNEAGNHVYPPNASKMRPVPLKTPHEITLRVRDRLINVLINGELDIAYELPIARRHGHLQLITFDAQAEFLSFELRELPESTSMTPAANKTSAPVESVLPLAQARLNVVIAEKALATALAEPDSIRARAAAARVKFSESDPTKIAEYTRFAVLAERTVAQHKAEEATARAELDLARAPADQKAKLEVNLKAARDAEDAARKAVGTPDETFTMIPGALKTLESNLESEASRRKQFPSTSSGRRTAFAQWLTDPRNPLAARVAVNHIWSRHFGRPLVPSVFDFGRKGSPPTHPELLDWLAVELRDGPAGAERKDGNSAKPSAWSMKHIHRLIVLSNTYRMTSSSAEATPRNLSQDPDNRFLWRSHPIRMEAQSIRDSLLQLAGTIDLKLGGPTIPSNNESSMRRSLYFFQSHNEHNKFLESFDDANVLECYRRDESIIPQQALALENSSLATGMAEKIARRLAGTDEEFIRSAFRLILATDPSADEMAACHSTLSRLGTFTKAGSQSDATMKARKNLVLALLNHNDFVTVR